MTSQEDILRLIIIEIKSLKIYKFCLEMYFDTILNKNNNIQKDAIELDLVFGVNF